MARWTELLILTLRRLLRVEIIVSISAGEGLFLALRVAPLN
jgi:hypothetical protein